MFRKLISGVTSTAVIGGLVTAGAVAASVATAAPAAAETVTIGAVSAQMAGHTGKASGTAGNAANCIRFAPPDTNDNPAVKTEWVTGSNEAAAGHGKPTSGTFDGQCPPTLIKTIPGGQSAVGITPTAEQSADTDNPFLLGTMRHYNNPINVQEDPAKFVGDLNIEFKGEVFTFPYELYETPNQCNGKVDDEQVNCSDDILTFTSTPTGEVDIQVDGVTYAFSLVASGFTGPDEEGICPVSPDPAATAKTKFITTEGKITTGCLYGELAQKRSITLVKKVEWNPDVTGPTTIPDFAFTSTSDLVGSPWKTDPGNLKPANTNPGTASYGPKDFRAGVETVTITEGADPTNWTFKDVQCVADGKVLTAADGVTPSGRTVELKNVPDATTQAAVPITCTYTNTYTPPGINVVKTANKAEVHAGDSVIYSYAVTNTGLSPLSNVTLVDDKCQSVSGPTKT
ncbi:MAG TPA: choice-of-anchor K domain-containing protein, partial [Actinomycetota bacterium]|nr:choice-of-anchor K domain-containing protein [Actinomycetota bacterium]